MSDTTLDVITIGRCSVDLYGEQVGGPLEDMASFAKYVGGSPTNMAIGTAKLGLQVRRHHRRRRRAHGPLRPRGAGAPGGRDAGRRHRPRAADRARHPRHPRQAHLPADLLPRELRRQRAHRGRHRRGPDRPPRAVVVTGTHFSRPNLDAMSRKAIRLAKAKGARVGLDIDYRPVLWGLTGHGLGEERFVSSRGRLRPPPDHPARLRPDRRHRGGGPHRGRRRTDTLAAIRTIRELGARGADRGQARADGLRRLPGPDPGRHRARA